MKTANLYNVKTGSGIQPFGSEIGFKFMLPTEPGDPKSAFFGLSDFISKQ